MAQQAIPNPYIISGPIKDSRSFFGHQDIFEWLIGHLEQSTQPLILYGPPKIGKSSILKEIERERLGEQFFTIYIDLNHIALDSLSIFLWELANAATTALTHTDMIVPDLQQTIFVADPLNALSQLLQTAVSHLQDRQLLFLFDNLQIIHQQIQKEHLPANIFDQLRHQFSIHSVYTIFALTQEPFSHLHNTFPNAHQRLIPPLSKDAATALIRQPTAYTIFQDVAHYIYQLTNGHPHDIQHICYALHEYQQQKELHQITIADVVLIKTHTLKQINFKSTPASRLPAYNVSTSNRQRRRSFASRARWLLLLFLLILIPTIAFLTLSNNNVLAQLPFASGPTPTRIVRIVRVTPTPTPTIEGAIAATSTATNTPTNTPTIPPTETPTIPPTETAVIPPTPLATATALPVPISLTNIITRTEDNMPMILIPAGTFIMGSTEADVQAGIDEYPAHEVTLDPFYLDKFEVSVVQYATFLTRQGDYRLTCDGISCALPRESAGTTSYLLEQNEGDGSLQYMSLVGFADYPINHVSWYGANSYCQAVGGRLPTEAEWEYAARGEDGRIYPWGNQAPTPIRAVFASESYANLKPVDALADGVSPFGIYGMAGSMWEWTADWYAEDYYNESPSENPQGPETGLNRVTRGGGWPNDNQADRLRAANRNGSLPEFYSAAIGFRCARSITP